MRNNWRISILILAGALFGICQAVPERNLWFYDGSIDRFGYTYFPKHRPIVNAEVSDANLLVLVESVKTGKLNELSDLHRVCVISYKLSKPHFARDAIGNIIDEKIISETGQLDAQSVSSDYWLSYMLADAMTGATASDVPGYSPSPDISIAARNALRYVQNTTFESKEERLVKASIFDLKLDYDVSREVLRKLSKDFGTAGIGLFYARSYMNGTSMAPTDYNLSVKIIAYIIAKYPNLGRPKVLAAHLLKYSDISQAKEYARAAMSAPDTLPREKKFLEQILLIGKR